MIADKASETPSRPVASPRVFAAAGWMALSKAGTQIFSWIGTFYVASRLLPEDYGLSNLATAFTEFAVILTNLGIGTTLVQRQADRAKADVLFTASVIMGLLLAGSALGLAYFGAWYFRNPGLVRLTQFTALVYLLSSLTIVPYNFLSRDMRFKERGLLDMYSTVLSIGVQMAMATLGMGVWTLLWGSAIRFGARLGLAFFYSGYRPALRWDWRSLKEDLGFSVQLTLNWFLFVLKERSVPIILGRAYSVTQLGLLGFAGTLAGIPNLKVVQLLREILLPLLAKRSHSPAAQLQGLATALKGMALLLVPVYLCGYHFGSDVLTHVLQGKWAPMFPVFEALCLVQMWNVLSSITGIYNTAQGLPVRSTWLELGMATAVPAVTFALRRMELVQLAHVWSLLGATGFLLWFAFLFRREKAFLRGFLSQLAAVVLVCAAAFGVDALLLKLLDPPSTLAVAAGRAALFLALYGAWLRLYHWEFLRGLKRK